MEADGQPHRQPQTARPAALPPSPYNATVGMAWLLTWLQSVLRGITVTESGD